MYYDTLSTMTLQHTFDAIRRYGLRGIFDFIRSLSARAAARRKMEKTLITATDWQPQPGITVIGHFSDAYSLSKVLRDFVTRLKACGIPCQTLDIGCDDPIPASEYAHLLTPVSDFRLNRYTDIVGMFVLPPLPKTNCRLSRIGFWEFESGLLAYYPEFSIPLEIIAMSDFAHDVFRRLVPESIPVQKILYPFLLNHRQETGRDAVRARYGIAPGDFVVFYNFSYRSSYYRKNPEAAVRAFAEAFGACDQAKIVFKTMGARSCPATAAKLRTCVENLEISERTVFIDDYVPQDELIALTAACDVYLSLHRGEGFGLGIAEAMSLGKPVIVTDYSAPTEFCNRDNALLVPYTLVPVKACEHDIDAYARVKEWAEPNVHAAAAALRRLYDDHAFARELGERGRRFIDDHFSDANFRQSVLDFLVRGESSTVHRCPRRPSSPL